MTPLEMAHQIMEFAAFSHARELQRSFPLVSQDPELNARQLKIRQNLGDLKQVTDAYGHIAGIIEDARLPTDPAITVHPSRYLALAKKIDDYLQELGFKSMQKTLYDAFTKARKEAKTPAF